MTPKAPAAPKLATLELAFPALPAVAQQAAADPVRRVLGRVEPLAVRQRRRDRPLVPGR